TRLRRATRLPHRGRGIGERRTGAGVNSRAIAAQGLFVSSLKLNHRRAPTVIDSFRRRGALPPPTQVVRRGFQAGLLHLPVWENHAQTAVECAPGTPGAPLRRETRPTRARFLRREAALHVTPASFLSQIIARREF